MILLSLAAFFFWGTGSARAAADAPAYLDELVSEARRRNLQDDRMWRLLLHYRRTRLGTLESQADAVKFFLARTGKRDPAAELEATLTAFFEPVPADPEIQHPSCRFPARFAWLSERLKFDGSRMPQAPCKRFDEWREAVDPDGVVLVFADAYINNPASMYGHTFLRLHRRAGGAGEDLLDYTVNFAGTPDTANAMLYALRGIIGAFPGEFSTMPFYIKVQEYNNIESRDLWEYKLNLTQNQIDRLVRHLWEMGSTYFDYFFFSENCSYQLLTALDVAGPGLHLSDRFGFGVIPADTARAVLEQKGLVASRAYRPSHARAMLARRARLSAAEVAAATALARRGDDGAYRALDAFSPERRAATLDAAYDYFRFRVGFDVDLDAEARRADRRLLLARRETGVPAFEPPTFPNARPLEDGHATARLGLGAGIARDSSYEQIEWRAALHDLADAPAGYVPDSQLEMGDIRFRYDNRDREFYPESVDLVKIFALSPWDRWIRKPTWDFNAGAYQAKELDCQGWSCAYYGMTGGFGLAARSEALSPVLGYAVAEADSGLGPVFRRDWRLGGGGRAGLVLEPVERWRIQLEGVYYRYLKEDDGPTMRLRLVNAVSLGKDLALRLSIERRTPRQEVGLAFYWYY